MRLIDADALGLTDMEIIMCNGSYKEALKMLLDKTDHAPTIEPERKKGRWIDYSDEGYVECPFCHSATNCDGNKDELHYCFSCGAELK